MNESEKWNEKAEKEKKYSFGYFMKTLNPWKMSNAREIGGEIAK